jgi:myo-inositol-1-phosphate synthase
MPKIKVAIVGVGNCTSLFIQGLEFYKKSKTDIGLMNKKEVLINEVRK